MNAYLSITSVQSTWEQHLSNQELSLWSIAVQCNITTLLYVAKNVCVCDQHIAQFKVRYIETPPRKHQLLNDLDYTTPAAQGHKPQQY